MMYAAIIVAGLAVIALAVFGLVMADWAADLGKSEADRDRLEEQLRELAEDQTTDAAAAKARVKQLLAEQEKLRAEIRRRRRPGDALGRLRVLSKTPGEAPGPDSQDGA